jgi:hypothetical protein
MQHVHATVIQGDQKVCVHLMKNAVYSNHSHTTDDLKMAITGYIRNVDRAMLNTVFENKFGVSINVWKLEGDTLNITCNFLYCNHQVHRDFLITLYKFHKTFGLHTWHTIAF